jgi:sec-independent protein translocase protein TatB
MFGIGTGELILVLIIAVLVVGPEKMVVFARDAGRWLARFRSMTDGVTKEFQDAFSLDAIMAEDQAEGEKAASGAGEAAGSEAGTAALPESLPAVDSAVRPAVGDDSSFTLAELAPSETLGATTGDAVEASVNNVSAEDNPDAEPVVIEVAEVVPEDVDVEPTMVGEVVVVTDEASSDDN